PCSSGLSGLGLAAGAAVAGLADVGWAATGRSCSSGTSLRNSPSDVKSRRSVTVKVSCFLSAINVHVWVEHFCPTLLPFRIDRKTEGSPLSLRPRPQSMSYQSPKILFADTRWPAAFP